MEINHPSGAKGRDERTFIDHEIFKAYDIRGIYPREINEGVAYKIGRALVKFLKKKNLKIVVGRDQRPSSQILKKKLIEGILDQGANIIDIGLSTSPLCYFAIAKYQFDGGVQVTASHLPKEYNGFKLLRKKAIFIGENTGLKKIEKIVQETKKERPKRRGKIRKKRIIKDYFKFNLEEFKRFQRLRVVIDNGKSICQILIPQISDISPLKIYHISPDRPLNPLEKGALKFLKREVGLKKADLGVAFDGDGDRIIFVSEKGGILRGDLILALLSKFILKENPGEKILYDVSCSKIVPETIKKYGGKPVLSRIGHTFVSEKMRRENVFFGGEFSGHYYHKRHYFFEAPLFVLFKILEIISKEKKPISKLILPFQKYYHSGLINLKLGNKKAVLKKIEKKYKGGKVLKIDGLRVEFEDFWFNLRPSQTESVLRLTIEAKTKKLLGKKKKELITLIEKGKISK